MTSPSAAHGGGGIAHPGSTNEASRGAAYGVGAYLLWGAMPFYFRLLLPAGPWEIVADRMLFSLLVCLVLLVATGGMRQFGAVLADRRQWAALSLAGVLVSLNWTIYLVAVTSGHITDAALGYFLNPLVSVALGLVVLGERLRPLQWAAVTVGAGGGLFLAVTSGSVPYYAIALALTFGVYGLVKKRLGARLSALESMTGETILVLPVAVAILAWHAAHGSLTFTALGVGHSALLASTGVMTAVPLLLFAGAARRVPLVTIGMLQFIAPILQFVSGLLLGETMTNARWCGFGIVWLALAIFLTDSVGTAARHCRRAAPATP